eukprot:COSAG06_NODE_9128_length_1980_cov_1.166401_1_plen_443_part_10
MCEADVGLASVAAGAARGSATGWHSPRESEEAANSGSSLATPGGHRLQQSGTESGGTGGLPPPPAISDAEEAVSRMAVEIAERQMKQRAAELNAAAAAGRRSNVKSPAAREAEDRLHLLMMQQQKRKAEIHLRHRGQQQQTPQQTHQQTPQQTPLSLHRETAGTKEKSTADESSLPLKLEPAPEPEREPESESPPPTAAEVSRQSWRQSLVTKARATATPSPSREEKRPSSDATAPMAAATAASNGGGGGSGVATGGGSSAGRGAGGAKLPSPELLAQVPGRWKAKGWQEDGSGAAEEDFILECDGHGHIIGRPWDDADSGGGGGSGGGDDAAGVAAGSRGGKTADEPPFVMRGSVFYVAGSPRPLSDGSGGFAPRRVARIDLVQIYPDGVRTDWSCELVVQMHSPHSAGQQQTGGGGGGGGSTMKGGQWSGGLNGRFEAVRC